MSFRIFACSVAARCSIATCSVVARCSIRSIRAWCIRSSVRMFWAMPPISRIEPVIQRASADGAKCAVMGASVRNYRTTIVYLHLAQPVARGWGRLRGKLWPPDIGARHAAAATPGIRRQRATRDRPGDPADVSRAGPDGALERAMGRPRRPAHPPHARAVGREIGAHDTWQEERGKRSGTRRSRPAGGGLDLRTMLEEHEEGRCLFRVSARPAWRRSARPRECSWGWGSRGVCCSMLG